MLKPQLMTNKWLKAFFISHIFGWIIAWLQTVWIILEVRKMKK